MGVAIVAIPVVDDYVWKISSEKIPHLTLLFLGDEVDSTSAPRIAEFLQHVANTSLFRFGLSVDKRGTLGDDEADVLFFRDGWDLKQIKEARHNLLQNDLIFKAYNSTEQFPSWTPHLTLGYPESPAHPIDRDYPINWVEFDRLAIWFGDFDGPEFELKHRFDGELAMSAAQISNGSAAVDQLLHYGVVGMKWGVRRARKAQAEASKAQIKTNKAQAKSDKAAVAVRKAEAAASKKNVKLAKSQAETSRANLMSDKKTAKADARWEKTVTKKAYTKAYNSAAKKMDRELLTINNDPAYKGVDFSFDSPIRRTYYNDISTRMTSLLNEEAAKFGQNASGTKQLSFDFYDVSGSSRPTARIVPVDNRIKHAESDVPAADVRIIWTQDGHIKSLEIVEESMSDTVTHGETSVGNILSHYGVKGMKWGVRKERSPSAVEVTQKRPGGRLTTKGGQNQPASEDAKRAATAAQKAKASTVDSLSDQELTALVRRMNLEQQYHTLSQNRKGPIAKFIEKLFVDQAKKQTTAAFNAQADAYGQQVREKLAS